MTTAQASPAERGLGRILAAGGGGLTLLVSLGVTISLPLRNVGYNLLNGLTLIVAAAAGVVALRAAARSGSGLIWALALLVVAMIPTLFGWVVLLYMPSLILLIAAVATFATDV